MRNRLLFLLLFGLVESSISQTVLTDDLGREIRLDAPAVRIVSLAPSITEIVCAIGACDNLIGVTDYCNFPPEVERKEQVGGIITPGIEAIVNLEPDMVLVTPQGNLKESFNQLEQLGIPVFVTNPKTINETFASIRTIGILTGHRTEAFHLADSLEKRLDGLDRGENKRMMLLVAIKPLIAVGTGSFLAEMVERAGGENIAGGSGLPYPPLSREQVIAGDPEVIILTAGLINETEDLLEIYPEWKQVTAIQTGAVFSIDADVLSRPGPRLVEATEALRQCLVSD